MTAVEIKFRYQGRLPVDLLPRTQADHRDFGIRRIQVDETNKLIAVEYDATRQDSNGVEAVLRRAGVPVTELLKS